MTRLDSFLAAATRMPFAWDALNCLTFPADWVRVARGVDLAEGFRGRFRTALGAERFLRRQGGLLAFAAARAKACGLAPTELAICGDIGVTEVIGLDGKRVAVGAICTGRRWAMLGRAGLLVSETRHLAAWRV